MRIIKFKVQNDTIIKDPDSDFSNLSKESTVQAQFTFSRDWDGYIKVAGFSRGTTELEPRVLQNGTTCEIPYKALRGTFFRLYLLGKKGTEQHKTKTILINTNEK